VSVQIIQGDCMDELPKLAAESVHCVVTSTPYWGLRDYNSQPRAWDGSASCAHEWGPVQKTPWVKSIKGPNGNGKNGTTYANLTKSHGQWCQRCGAWLGCLGLEPTYQMFVEHMRQVFREVWRVLRDDGTLWLNLGDSYHNGDKGGYAKNRVTAMDSLQASNLAANFTGAPNRMPQDGLKSKDLTGIPWRVALELQSDGWYLRQDVIWRKPNPMPESVLDRCTKSHEYIFLLTKNERYYFNAEAIAEESSGVSGGACFGKVNLEGPGSRRISPEDNDRIRGSWKGSSFDTGKTGEMKHTRGGTRKSGNKERKPASTRGVPVDTDGSTNGAVAGSIPWEGATRNKRDVWSANEEAVLLRWLLDEHPEVAAQYLGPRKLDVWDVTIKPYKAAHFATFPPDLIKPCILAGCPEGGTVLDPFFGSGTTGEVATACQCHCIGIELNPEYVKLANRRTQQRSLLT
jgi:DNA modification methylase